MSVPRVRNTYSLVPCSSLRTHYSAITTNTYIVLDNGTYTGGVVAHLSQLFFDQKLIDAVEQLAPYNTNQIPQTPNLEDLFSGFGATEDYDPFVNYIVLGNDLSSGLFAWAELALNTVSQRQLLPV